MTVSEYNNQYDLFISSHIRISNTGMKLVRWVDVEVENALYKLALGYTVKLCKHYKLKYVYFDERNRRCEKEELVEAYDEEHIPANVNAQKFWLANRKTDVWRERHEAEVSAQALENAKDILGGVDSAIE